MNDSQISANKVGWNFRNVHWQHDVGNGNCWSSKQGKHANQLKSFGECQHYPGAYQNEGTNQKRSLTTKSEIVDPISKTSVTSLFPIYLSIIQAAGIGITIWPTLMHDTIQVPWSVVIVTGPPGAKSFGRLGDDQANEITAAMLKIVAAFIS